MPIRVEIKLNTKTLANMTISRVEGMPVADSVNSYLVQYADLETGNVRSKHVVHRYGDPVDVLVRKAMDALTEPVARARRIRCGAPIVDSRGQYRTCRKVVAHGGRCHLHREEA